MMHPTKSCTAAVPIEYLDSCPLCGGMSWKNLAVPGRWIGSEIFAELEGRIGLVRCRSCALTFTNPRPSSDRLSAFYAGSTYTCHDTDSSGATKAKARFLLERIAQYLPKDAPATLLDYGAGGGGFLQESRAQGWSVRGFEPGARGLESCRQAGLDVTDRLADLPAHGFSVVTLHHVFEHLPNPTEVLKGIQPLLAKNGRLFIEVPNVRSLRARLAWPLLSRRMSIDERHRAFPIHLMYYSASTLRRVLEHAGWAVETTFTVGLGLDEYFIRPASGERPGVAASRGAAAPGQTRRRLRHVLRDAFLRIGLGENIAVIATPQGEAIDPESGRARQPHDG